MIWFRAVFQVIALSALMFCALGAACLSVGGMVHLFPAAGFPIVFMAVAMQGAKFIIAGWLARRWHETFWLWRLLLVGFVLDLMSINAVAVYSQLAAACVECPREVVAAIAAAPFQCMAALLGLRPSGEEEVVRGLVAAIVLSFDPCAVAMTAALAARWRTAA